ncbi:MAG: DUF120 domain-containing protein [Candidatus Nanohaloarchaea archaeon]
MTELKGEVFSGSGEAAGFLRIEEYSRFLEDILGEKPFPGTLNLRVGIDKLEELKKTLPSKRLEPFEKDGNEFGGINVFPVKFEETDALLLEIDKTHHGDSVAEIVASLELREKYSLKDNDTVTVKERS